VLKREGLRRASHLFALSAFAVAQPLLDLLRSHPGFFAARQAPPADVVGLAIVLLIAPPLLLWALEGLVGAFSARAARGLHLGLLALLAATIALPPLARSTAAPAAVALCGAGLAGLGMAWAYRRFQALRSWVSVLALAPFVFAAVFLADPAIRRLVVPPERAPVEIPPVRSDVPVVLVVFDELSLTSLLDEHGAIDPVRYPHFARLARESTWFRNASSVDTRTLIALPAILTGRYPGPRRRVPVAAEHPHNLFALLAGSYEMNVLETHTMLFAGTDPAEPALARAGSLASDLALVYAHLLLPASLAEGLPPVHENWKHFAEQAGDPGAAGLGGWGPVMRKTRLASRDRPGLFRYFVRSIQPTAAPGFHFLHVRFPHNPWQYLPSGKTYFPFQRYLSPWDWPPEEWWTIEAYQRHLLQVAFVDRLLGELLDRLERIGLYEPALLAVMADHGVNFWPNENHRDFARGEHPEDILSIPLFIKRPYQQTGSVSLRNVETIDVFPSIVDVLGIELAWKLDGCSVFDPACPQRPDKTAFTSPDPRSDRNEEVHFDPDVCLRDESLRRKLALFGSGSTDGLYRFGPYARLVGRAVSELDVAGRAGTSIVLEQPRRTLRLGARDVLAPVRVAGLLAPKPPGERPQVAVAVDGIIRSVVPAPPEGRKGPRVAAMIPEEALGEREPALSLYLVRGAAEAPELWEIGIRR
jgi:hypothetical protein